MDFGKYGVAILCFILFCFWQFWRFFSGLVSSMLFHNPRFTIFRLVHTTSIVLQLIEFSICRTLSIIAPRASKNSSKRPTTEEFMSLPMSITNYYAFSKEWPLTGCTILVWVYYICSPAPFSAFRFGLFIIFPYIRGAAYKFLICHIIHLNYNHVREDPFQLILDTAAETYMARLGSNIFRYQGLDKMNSPDIFVHPSLCSIYHEPEITSHLVVRFDHTASHIIKNFIDVEKVSISERLRT